MCVPFKPEDMWTEANRTYRTKLSQLVLVVFVSCGCHQVACCCYVSLLSVIDEQLQQIHFSKSKLWSGLCNKFLLSNKNTWRSHLRTGISSSRAWISSSCSSFCCVEATIHLKVSFHANVSAQRLQGALIGQEMGHVKLSMCVCVWEREAEHFKGTVLHFWQYSLNSDCLTNFRWISNIWH